VVIADAAAEGDFQFERQKFGTTENELRQLAMWLGEQGVRKVVMESMALYGRRVWQQLGGNVICIWRRPSPIELHEDASGISPDAERLLRRHVAGELLSS
jgi:hypothetical protein